MFALPGRRPVGRLLEAGRATLGQFANTGRNAQGRALRGNHQTAHSRVRFVPSIELIAANDTSGVARLALQRLGFGYGVNGATPKALPVKYSHEITRIRGTSPHLLSARLTSARAQNRHPGVQRPGVALASLHAATVNQKQ
jgi:hypothetical protein